MIEWFTVCSQKVFSNLKNGLFYIQFLPRTGHCRETRKTGQSSPKMDVLVSLEPVWPEEVQRKKIFPKSDLWSKCSSLMLFYGKILSYNFPCSFWTGPLLVITNYWIYARIALNLIVWSFISLFSYEIKLFYWNFLTLALLRTHQKPLVFTLSSSSL